LNEIISHRLRAEENAEWTNRSIENVKEKLEKLKNDDFKL
jgi:hypothetical protein